MISFFPSRAVAVDVFGFGIHWYGLLYLLGFALGALLLPVLGRYRRLPLSRDDWYALLSWSVIGVIAGGRFGYVLFYEPAYFLANPADIVAVWKGGMSFHGGFLGVLATLWAYARARDISLLALADVIVIPVAIGLALGRLGNFVNQELYGTVTTLPWGMAFAGAEGLRHPIQFYEMATNLLAAGLCYWHLRTTGSRTAYIAGRTAAIFLMIYGTARFQIEIVREQQHSLVALWGIVLTRGQLLTVPVILLGVGLWIATARSPRR